MMFFMLVVCTSVYNLDCTDITYESKYLHAVPRNNQIEDQLTICPSASEPPPPPASPRCCFHAVSSASFASHDAHTARYGESRQNATRTCLVVVVAIKLGFRLLGLAESGADAHPPRGRISRDVGEASASIATSSISIATSPAGAESIGRSAGEPRQAVSTSVRSPALSCVLRGVAKVES